MDLKKLVLKLPSRHKRLIRLFLRGFSKEAVHRYTGWSRVTIDKYVNEIRDRLE